MSILFDAHEDPTNQHQSRKGRARNLQDERYPMQSKTDKYEDILVFGYQCKLFRDDPVAEDVNEGKYLIPWMGNKDLMIDRYDCRGHLYRLEEFDFEKMGEFRALSPERQDIENVCDEERYMDLNKNMTEESILEEEADKRGSALYDPFTAYQNIEYAYDDSTEGKTLTECDNESKPNTNFDNDSYAQFCQYYGYNPNDANLKAYFQSQNNGQYQYDYDRPPPPSEPPPSTDTKSSALETSASVPYELFEPPVGVEIPKGMEIPETKKMQAIIEKTASFISKQSAQMEIVLKTKQSGNPQFAFLDFDNYLNPYYRLILEKIKEGTYEYKEKDDKTSEDCTDQELSKKNEDEKNGENNDYGKDDEDSDEDSDDGDGELHPLLQAHKRPLNQAAPSSPTPLEVEEPKPIMNQVAQTKLTGKVEDLAKVYMTWKYTPNPSEAKSEEVEDENKSTSLEGVEELPPPPLPPPPSFVLPDMNGNSLSTDTNNPPPSQQQFEEMSQQEGMQIEEAFKQQQQPPQLMRFAPPMIPPPPVRPHFPQIRFQPPPQVIRPPFPIQIHRNMPPPSGHFLGGPFQHMPHQIQYSHPAEIYQVRSSVPPPPPPPIPSLPSLLPPGVDAPSIPSINSLTSFITTGTIQTNIPPHVSTSYSQPNTNSTELQPSLIANLPPVSVVTSVQQQKRSDNPEIGVPPPPLPPMVPPMPNVMDLITSDVSKSNFDKDITGDTLEKFSSNNRNEENDRTNTPNDTREHRHRHRRDGEDKNKSSDEDDIRNRNLRIDDPHIDLPQESKRRKRSKGIHRDCSEDLNLGDSHESLAENIVQYETGNHSQPSSSRSIPTYEQNMRGSSSNSNSPTSSNSTVTFPTKLVTPGKDLQLVIDRLALYVAKNGEEFEVGIKDKKDPRFDFLNPWNIFHPYYSRKKNSNLNQATKEKTEEEERRKNLKVKFGLKSKIKPVSVPKKKKVTAAASVFNQNEEEEEEEGGPSVAPAEGFQPNKDPEVEVKRKLQKQIEEKERLLKQLQEQALLQQKIAEVNKQASIKPMLQNLTPQQQAILKKKVQEKQSKKEFNILKQDERKKRAASFVGMLKKNAEAEAEDPSDSAGSFLRKRQFKETGGSKDGSESSDRANYEKKKDAFFKAINDAFKGT